MRRAVLICGLATLLSGLGGCEGKRSEPAAPAKVPVPVTTKPAPPPPKPAAKPAPVGRGRVVGRVVFSGQAPERKLLDRSQDPFCEKIEARDESVLVNANGTLRNVLVRVVGLEAAAKPPPEPAELNQKDCVFRPRVQGVVAGRKVAIKNGDATLHNVHTYRGAATLFNQAQPQGGKPILKRMKAAKPGDPDVITVKCDVHPWMVAHIFVSTHAQFAVTGEDGTFSLAGVPAGRHTVEAWHEVYGTKTVEVDVKADGEVRAELSFSPGPG